MPNVVNVNRVERQYPLVAVARADYAHPDTTDDLLLAKFNIPGNAIIDNAFIEVVEGFDTSSLVIDGGGLFTVANVAIGATGRTAGAAFTAATGPVEVTVKRSLNTDATGLAYLTVSYLRTGRQSEVQP